MWRLAVFIIFYHLLESLIQINENKKLAEGIFWVFLSPAQLWTASTFWQHALRPALQLYSAWCCSEAERLISPDCLPLCRPSLLLASAVPPEGCQLSCCVWPSPRLQDPLHRAPALLSPEPRPGSLRSCCAVENARVRCRCSSLLWRCGPMARQSYPGPRSCCAAWGVRDQSLRPTARCSGSRHLGWTLCCSGLAPTVKTSTCGVGVEEEHLYDKERLKCQKSRGKGRQRHSGLLKAKWVIYQQGAGEVDTYKRDRLEGECDRKVKEWKKIGKRLT